MLFAKTGSVYSEKLSESSRPYKSQLWPIFYWQRYCVKIYDYSLGSFCEYNFTLIKMMFILVEI